MSKLILIRHGQSLWNEKGLWTGWTDIELSEKGREEARHAASLLRDIPIDEVYVSHLKRAHQTWEEIANVLDKRSLPVIPSDTLNERNYGDYTGKNKWELQKKMGDERFSLIRRGWDEPIPNGETLKDVYNRVVPYFKSVIFPQLVAGKNILISAHGNSLRALVKYLDRISDDEIKNIELKTGEIYVYTCDNSGHITKKEIFEKHLQ